MIDGLKPYSEYRDSDIPWVGSLPSHWQVQRTKSLLRKVDRPPRETDEVVTCFRDGVVTLRRNRRVTGFTESLKEIGYQGVRRGDLVVHAMDAFAGSIGVSDSDGKSTPVYLVCQPLPHADAHYFSCATREMARSQWIQALAKGIRERSTDFRWEMFGVQVMPVPPIDEQHAIVRFIDHADHQIRRYIAAKQKLIKLLEEQRQAVIHRAVTCGLDPDVRLKPSGVQWLDAVPEHWLIVANKSLLRYRKSVVGDRSSSYVLLSLTKQGIIPRDVESAVGKFPASFDTYQEVNPGNLVFCLFDIDETPRAVGLSDLHGMITGAYTRFECDKDMAPWVYHFYLAMDMGKRLKPLYGSLRKVITKSTFLRAKLPLPPAKERDAIVDYLASATGAADLSIARARREIAALTEYRTRLVADVVTGKLDVREAAASLPEIVDGDEPPGDLVSEDEADDDDPSIPEEAEA